MGKLRCGSCMTEEEGYLWITSNDNFTSEIANEIISGLNPSDDKQSEERFKQLEKDLHLMRLAEGTEEGDDLVIDVYDKDCNCARYRVADTKILLLGGCNEMDTSTCEKWKKKYQFPEEVETYLKQSAKVYGENPDRDLDDTDIDYDLWNDDKEFEIELRKEAKDAAKV